MKKPNFFIVGAPKCGTTALHYYLSQHPNIFMSPIKEPEFFGRDHNMINRAVDKMPDYLQLFTEAKQETHLGEASIWYLASQQAASEIKQFCPSAKIIIMLRNPVDLLYSLHNDLVYVGYEDQEDFATALAVMEERRKGNYIPGAVNVVQDMSYRDVVRFTTQVQRYFEVFGRDHVKVIIFDDLKTKTLQVYQDTLKFLEVDDTFQADISIINPRKEVRSKKLRDLINNIWLSSTFQKLNKILPKFIEAGLFEAFRFIRIKNSVRGQERPQMNPEIRKQLQAEFALEIQNLSQLIHRDLTSWNTD